MTASGDDDGAVLDLAEAWLGEGRLVALATVVRTWGSAPRPVGSHMAVAAGGGFAGSVSGGCIEAAVIAEAEAVLADHRGRTIDFAVGDAQAWDFGLACGGAISIHVAPLEPALLAALQAFRRQRRPVAVVTDPASGVHALVSGDGVACGGLALAGDAVARVRVMLGDDASGGIDGGLFVRSYGPPWSLVIVGATHIAQALAPMAALAGLTVTVVDPRRAFATPERLPGVNLVVGWPDEVLAADPPCGHTAVVTLTHDAKIDDPALAAALRSPAFHVGALGSRRTHARRLERLAAEGFAESDLARINGPVGLDLGGRAPGEIAVAILAEVVAARYGRRLSPSPVG